MAKRPDIPFKEIAGAALSYAETLLPQWVGGKRASNEWQAERRAKGGFGDSLTINLTSGAWIHGSAAAEGGDLISLYAYVHSIAQNIAAIEVADQIGFKLPDGCRPKEKAETDRKPPVVDITKAKKTKPKEPSLWVPVIPAPADAGEPPLAHYSRGPRQEYWTYYAADGIGIIGYVYRYKTSDGGKETLPVVYCRHNKTGKGEWRWLSFPQPRPLYGLDRLAAKPDAYVLLVEGEKCADAAVDLVQGACVTWPGGCKAVGKTDFSQLAGRKIYAWADCDAQREPLTRAEKTAGVDPQSKPLLPEHEQPGMKAMRQIQAILLKLDPSTEFHFVDIPAPGEKPDGWDIADAIVEGMSAAKLLNFITSTRPQPFLVVDNTKTSESKTGAILAAAEKQDSTPKWIDCMLRKRGDLVACLANVVDILENDERWAGVLAYDEFAQQVVKLKKPPFWNNRGETGEWDAQDDARAAMWITKIWRFSPSAALVAEAIEVMARNNIINPPKDWLQGLKWDEVKRVDRWMLDFMSVPLTEYSRRVARWFFMGMVKRVLEPGCKFDYCLVLEGTQGRKKSTALSIIGGEWYGDTDLDLHNKDSMSALRGKMLYEFSELGSVAKAEATKQKSFLSRQIDEYRPVYGRREIRAPRQLVFCGTTNEWEWNKDPTGGRRFWPISIDTEIDVEGLKAVRDQLFAEAVVMVNMKLRYWPTTQEQAELFDGVQLQRTIQDSLLDCLHDHVMGYNEPFSMHYAATEWLQIKDITKLTRDIQSRIGSALARLGCTKIEKRNDKICRSWYKPPERKPAESTDQAVAQQGGDDDIPW